MRSVCLDRISSPSSLMVAMAISAAVVLAGMDIFAGVGVCTVGEGATSREKRRKFLEAS